MIGLSSFVKKCLAHTTGYYNEIYKGGSNNVPIKNI